MNELRNKLNFETAARTFRPIPPLLPLPTSHLWTKLSLPLTKCTPPWVNTQQNVRVTLNKTPMWLYKPCTRSWYNQNMKLKFYICENHTYWSYYQMLSNIDKNIDNSACTVHKRLYVLDAIHIFYISMFIMYYVWTELTDMIHRSSWRQYDRWIII